MKLTALEYLLANLIQEPFSEEHFKYNFNVWNIAEKMEKQQIIEAHGSKLKKSSGVTNYEYWYTGEMYYNDNFKNEKDGE